MNKQEILTMIGLTEDEYSMAVFETAMEYLEEKAGQFALDISQTKSFWMWWRYQWQVIDDIFYAEMMQSAHNWKSDPDTALYIWRDDHRMDMRKTGIPNPVWAEYYCNMMHAVNKEVTREGLAA